MNPALPPLRPRPRDRALDAALALAAAAVAVFASAWWVSRTLIPPRLVAVCGVAFGLNLLALAGVIYAFSRRAMPDGARLTLRALLIAVFAFCSMAAVPAVARPLLDREVARLRATAHALIPQLDQHLRTTGLYPRRLAELEAGRDLPPGLRRPDVYHSSGTGFVLRIRLPGASGDAVVWRSGSTNWSLVHTGAEPPPPVSRFPSSP
jgi:hypothetical protein